MNGHIHTPTIDGSRIQVGTFTGGGVVSHFIATEDEELTGQPYAFDFVSFGPLCALTQLTRYTYRNLIEGRPLYDNIQVVNGAIIDPRGAQETRDADAAEAARAPEAAQPGEPAQPAEPDAVGEQPRSCSQFMETTIREIPTATPDDSGTSTPATVRTSTLTPSPPSTTAPSPSPSPTVTP